MFRNLLAALFLALATGTAVSEPTPTAAPVADSANVAQVWQREADYWRYVAAGDVDTYVALWDDRFIG